MNTDMSLALAVFTTAFGVGVAVALWCGLFDRLLQAVSPHSSLGLLCGLSPLCAA